METIILRKPLNNKQEGASTFTEYNYDLGRSNPPPEPYIGPIEIWTPSIDCDNKKQTIEEESFNSKKSQFHS